MLLRSVLPKKRLKMLSEDPLKREAYNTLSGFDVKALKSFNFESIFDVNLKLNLQTKLACITLTTWLRRVRNYLGKPSVSAAVLAAVPKREAHYRDPNWQRNPLFNKNVWMLVLCTIHRFSGYIMAIYLFIEKCKVLLVGDFVING